MRAWLVVAAGALLLLAAAAAKAPAALVDRELDALTEGRLRVADAAGTIWNGAGTLVVLPYAARVPVRWHIDALPLMRSRLRGTISQDTAQASPSAPSQEATFELSSDDFAVRGLAFSLPAEALLRAGDAPAIVAGAGGIVNLRADAFAMRGGAFEGGFVARWQGATLPGPRADVGLALGDVNLEAIANGAEIKGVLSNAGGDIEINGTVTAAATGAARADAHLKPRAGVDAERSKAIQSALSMVGVPDPSGGVRVQWQAPGR